MNITTRPIGDWPGKQTPDWKRQRSPFRTQWTKVITLLERELGHLRAKTVVLEIDVRPSDLRLDGQLRANARPQGPRVIVSAETKHGPMRIPCDTYTDHQSNLYAIAMSLEKLRAVDRYGVTMHGEQYKGWTAIPSATAGRDPIATAWDLIEREAGVPANQPRTLDNLQYLYRAAARRAHPDTGGSNERFTAVGNAKDLLQRSFQ